MVGLRQREDVLRPQQTQPTFDSVYCRPHLPDPRRHRLHKQLPQLFWLCVLVSQLLQEGIMQLFLVDCQRSLRNDSWLVIAWCIVELFIHYFLLALLALRCRCFLLLFVCLLLPKLFPQSLLYLLLLVLLSNQLLLHLFSLLLL